MPGEKHVWGISKPASACGALVLGCATASLDITKEFLLQKSKGIWVLAARGYGAAPCSISHTSMREIAREFVPLLWFKMHFRTPGNAWLLPRVSSFLVLLQAGVSQELPALPGTAFACMHWGAEGWETAQRGDGAGLTLSLLGLSCRGQAGPCSPVIPGEGDPKVSLHTGMMLGKENVS